MEDKLSFFPADFAPYFVFGLIGFAALAMLTGRVRYDFIAVVVLCALVLSGIMTPTQALAGGKDGTHSRKYSAARWCITLSVGYHRLVCRFRRLPYPCGITGCHLGGRAKAIPVYGFYQSGEPVIAYRICNSLLVHPLFLSLACHLTRDSTGR